MGAVILAGLAGHHAAPVVSSPSQAAQRQAVLITAELWDTRRALDSNYARAVRLYEQQAGLIVEERSGPDGPRVSQVPIGVRGRAARDPGAHQAGDPGSRRSS